MRFCNNSLYPLSRYPGSKGGNLSPIAPHERLLLCEIRDITCSSEESAAAHYLLFMPPLLPLLVNYLLGRAAAECSLANQETRAVTPFIGAPIAKS